MMRSEAQSLSGQWSVGGATHGAPAICTGCAIAETGMTSEATRIAIARDVFMRHAPAASDTLPPTAGPHERHARLLVVVGPRVELAGKNTPAHGQFRRHAIADGRLGALVAEPRSVRRHTAERRRGNRFVPRGHEPPRRQRLRALHE